MNAITSIYILVVIFILYVVYMWIQRLVLKRCRLKESKTRKVPLLGHAVNFIGNSEDHLKYLQHLGQEATNNGGIVAIRMITDLNVLVTDPIKAEFLMKNCLDKGDYIKPMREIFGFGSIFAPVEFWRPRRRLVVPTFTSKNLRQFFTVFSKQSAIMAKKLRPNVGSGPFSVWPYMTTYTFDAICEAALGLKVNSQSDPNHPFLKAIGEGIELTCKRILSPWLHSKFIYQFTKNSKTFNGYREFIFNFIGQVISERRKEESEKIQSDRFTQHIKEDRGITKSMLQLLIESSDDVSDVELMEEAGVLLIAATDTTAVGASFCLLLMAAYPEIQEKAYNEINEVVGKLDRPLTPEDLSSLKYLECVIKESLRLYPPVPFITRKAETNVNFPSGETLPKNTNIFLSLWSIHRNLKYWGEDAETFRPERFLEPFTHPAQFVAFSYGPRNCIGYRYAIMSLKVAFANILRQYVIKPANTAPYNQWKKDHRPMRLRLEIMLKNGDDYLVQLEERKLKNKI